MIFEGILNHENNFTEMLKNLCEYKLFKKEFLKFITGNPDNLEKLKLDDVNIETQFRLSEDSKSGIVDMYIENDNKVYLLEIKIKPYTPLSEHQKQSDYQKWAKEQEKEIIVKYLIPKNYMYADKIDNNVKKLFLEDFMKNLKESGIYELNQYIKDFINFYYKFLWIDKQYEFNNREIQLMKGAKMNGINLMQDITVPELISKLYRIVDEIADKVGYVNKKRFVEQDSNSYGYLLKDNENVWFGIDYEVWKNKKSPLIIWIYEEDIDKKQKESLKNLGFEYIEFQDYDDPAYIYIFSLDEIQSLEKLVEKINQTKEALE